VPRNDDRFASFPNQRADFQLGQRVDEKGIVGGAAGSLQAGQVPDGLWLGNLVYNGDFELGNPSDARLADGWTVISNNVSSTGCIGEFGLDIPAGSAGKVLVVNHPLAVPAAAGKIQSTVPFGCMPGGSLDTVFRTQAKFALSIAEQLQVDVVFLDRAGATVATTNLYTGFPGNAGWVVMRKNIAVPATGQFGRVVITYPLTGGQNQFWVDNLAIVPRFDPVVVADYTRTTTQAIANNTLTIVDFANVIRDTDAAVTTGAAWKFTCPAGKGGRYAVNAGLQITLPASVASDVMVDFYKNGAFKWRGNRFSLNAAGVGLWGLQMSCAIDLVPADYIDLRILQITTASRNIEASTNYINITRLGP
jgi:hypothetical protein